MQVFVTSPSLVESARVLDSARANKQIMECNQVYRAAIGESSGWANHCITRLWKDDLVALMFFAWCCYYKRLNDGGNPVRPVADIVEGVNVACAASNGLEDCVPTPHFVQLAWWTDAMKSHLLSKKVHHYGPLWPRHTIKSGYYAINKEGDWQLYSALKGDVRHENC
jgi:hypothetical protein